MAIPGHGTIVAGFQIPGSVVLAADRRVIDGHESNPIAVRECCKIAAHPTLPLAAAVRGIGTLVLGKPSHSKGRIESVELIENIFSSIKNKSDATPQALKRRFARMFLPIVLVQRDWLAMAGLNHRVFTDIVWASMVGGAGSLFTFRMEHSLTVGPRMAEIVAPPDSLYEFYHEMLHEAEEVRMRKAIKTAAGLAEYARGLVHCGIDRDATLNGGVNRSCGGAVDVVIVDAAGARFHEP
jgi:hypothetical protein